MDTSRWIWILYISIMFSFFNHLPSVISVKFSGAPAINFNLPLTTKEIRRLKAKGLEVVPSAEGGSITSNSVTSEPTCEELRAMWRYYKRQSRAAELTNQIPQIQLPDLFWDVPQSQQPSSFLPLRSRPKQRFRLNKSPSKQAYGRILMSPPNSHNNNNNKNSEGRRRRPIDEVIKTFGISNNNKNLLNNNDRVSEPTLHLSPPVEPTPESGFQKLRDMYRQERIKEHKTTPIIIESMDNSNSNAPPLLVNKDFGKMILTPPQGQDGRIANKPKELMSPFEKLRFHSDDILGIGDEIDGRRNMMTSFMSKRRNGFIGIPMLNAKDRMIIKPSSSSSSSSSSFYNKKYKNNNINENENENVNDETTRSRQIKSFNHGGGRGSSINDNSNSNDFLLPSTLSSHKLVSLGDDLGFNDDGMNNNIIDETLIPSGGDYYNLDSSEDPIILRRKHEMDTPPSCTQVENQICSTNSDCSCIGYGLYRCFMSQCQILSLISTDGEEWTQAKDEGIWHPNALAGKHLGTSWEQSSIPISSSSSSSSTMNRLEQDEDKKKKILTGGF